MQQFHDFDFLWHEKLADGLWRVVEDWGGPQKICIYVVEGDNRVAVIDSGLGATHGLRKYIETYITGKKPMICLLTHTHPDHAGGCTLFDAQYVHEDELPQVAWGLNDKRRVHDAAAFAFSGVPGSKCHGYLNRAMAVWEYCEEHYIPVDWKSIHWNLVRDGDILDLGGRRLECIYMNAHGTMIFYNREEDYALCGDNLTYTLALGDIDDEVIAKFEGLASRLTNQTMLYSGHLYYEDMVTRPEEITASAVRELIQVLKKTQTGGGLEDDPPEVKYDVPGAPTLMGFLPDPDDADAWAAYRSAHPERSGKSPKPGRNYIHKVGSIIVTYQKAER